MVVFGLTQFMDRPLSFSAAYALAFCCGVYFPRKLAWWLPLTTLLAVDLIENAISGASFQLDQASVYIAFALIILLGSQFKASSKWYSLLGGGLLGAILFYILTNTGSWWFNPSGSPEYTKDLKGWITALTKGITGYPATWVFFRNTLLSGGLFTGLFVGAMKLSEIMAHEEEEEQEPETEPSKEDPEPESA